MKAFIIYDDFACAARANTALQRAAHNADFTVLWNIRPWRVDILKMPFVAAEALGEAVDAHLIVFAGRRAQSIPAWLQRWLELWVAKRQVQDAALAVIGDGGNNPLSSSSTPELSQFARRHGLHFIFNDRSAAVDDAAVFMRRFREDKLSSSPIPQTANRISVAN